jgi:uncharacterized membrane protein (DUF2068 family)
MKKKQAHRNRILAAIAIFKYVKALLLIAGGLAAMKLLDHGVGARAEEMASQVSSGFIRHALERALGRAESMPHGRLVLLGLGAFFYAALFIVEGTGLWLEQRWAEYLTVIATGSFIPFECWELAHGINVVRAIAFILNIAIVIYLIQRLREKPASRHK